MTTTLDLYNQKSDQEMAEIKKICDAMLLAPEADTLGGSGDFCSCQIWQAQHPCCWTVVLKCVDIDETGEPLFMVESLYDHGIFHRVYNKTPYLFNAAGIKKLLGEKREYLGMLDDFITYGVPQ